MNELVFDAVFFLLVALCFCFGMIAWLVFVIVVAAAVADFFFRSQSWKFHVYFVLRVMIVCINKITQFKSCSYQNCIRLVHFKGNFSIQISAIAAAAAFSLLPSIKR